MKEVSKEQLDSYNKFLSELATYLVEGTDKWFEFTLNSEEKPRVDELLKRPAIRQLMYAAVYRDLQPVLALKVFKEETK